MARGRRLAARAREEHEILPALGWRGKHSERGRNAERGGARSGEGRSIYLRSKRRGAHFGRAAVLRTFSSCRAGAAGSKQSGGPQRRAGVYNACAGEGPGGHRACYAGLVREQLGGGYGFHREAGGRVAERVCAKPYGGNLAASLSELAREAG